MKTKEQHVEIEERLPRVMLIRTPYRIEMPSDRQFLCHAVMSVLMEPSDMAPQSDIFYLQIGHTIAYEAPVLFLQREFVAAFYWSSGFRKLYRRMDNLIENAKDGGNIIDVEDTDAVAATDTTEDSKSSEDRGSEDSEGSEGSKEGVKKVEAKVAAVASRAGRLDVPLFFASKEVIEFRTTSAEGKSVSYPILLRGISLRSLGLVAVKIAQNRVT